MAKSACRSLSAKIQYQVLHHQMNTNRNMSVHRVIFALVLLVPALAQAHPGLSGHEGGIAEGVAHSLSGMDHLLAALAVGMLATILGRVSIASSFLAFGIIGAVAGAFLGAFRGVEALIGLSVFVFGAMLVLRRIITHSVAYAFVALGAIAHGWAHGSEAANLLSLIGIYSGTTMVVASGAGIALAMRRMPRLMTSIGASIAIVAVGVLVGMI